MIKYKLTTEQWKELLKFLNPRVHEGSAMKLFREGLNDRAVMSLVMSELGGRVAKALFRTSKAHHTITFSYFEAMLMIDVVDSMIGFNIGLIYARNIISLMNIELNKQLINYKPKYQ